MTKLIAALIAGLFATATIATYAADPAPAPAATTEQPVNMAKKGKKAKKATAAEHAAPAAADKK